MAIHLKPKRTLMNVDVVPDLLSILVFHIRRWRQGRENSRPPIALVELMLRMVIGTNHHGIRIGVIERRSVWRRLRLRLRLRVIGRSRRRVVGWIEITRVRRWVWGWSIRGICCEDVILRLREREGGRGREMRWVRSSVEVRRRDEVRRVRTWERWRWLVL